MRLVLVPPLVALSVPVLPVALPVALALALAHAPAEVAAAVVRAVVLVDPGDVVAAVPGPLEVVLLVRLAAAAGPRHFPPDQRWAARDLLRPLRGRGRCD